MQIANQTQLVSSTALECSTVQLGAASFDWSLVDFQEVRIGVANRDLAVIESIAPEGRVTARLESGREISFDPTEQRHFDHGYAVTSHSAQGLTAERVLVNADTSVHPDLLNSRFGYVSISRASHEATLFTDNLAKLNPQLSADLSKTSALEIGQVRSIASEVGIGMEM